MLGLTVFPIFVNNFHFALTLQTVPLLALSAEPSSGEFFGRKDGRGRGQTCWKTGAESSTSSVKRNKKESVCVKNRVFSHGMERDTARKRH